MGTIKAKKEKKEWVIDKKGYFLIESKPEQKKIYVHHYTKNKKYNCTIVGKNAEEIYYTIIRKKLVSTLQHAAYLGKELQRAETYFKKSKGKYVQD